MLTRPSRESRQPFANGVHSRVCICSGSALPVPQSHCTWEKVFCHLQTGARIMAVSMVRWLGAIALVLGFLAPGGGAVAQTYIEKLENKAILAAYRAKLD